MVTGTGQGTRLTGIEVVVSQGVDGWPAAGPSSAVVLATQSRREVRCP